MSKKKYKRKHRYPYKLYIPENIEIEQILDLNKPEFQYNKDYFLYILHLITSIPLRLKDYDLVKQKGFTPIDKKLLSRRVHNYKNYIRFLVKNRIIIEGTSYKAGYYSRGIKFTKEYRRQIKGIYITKNTLIKSITEIHDYRDMLAERKFWFLKQWFNPRLTIDMEKVLQFLELDKQINRRKLEEKRSSMRRRNFAVSIDEIITFGYNLKFIVADKISEGKNHNPIVDRTSGRFHSPITQLKKELRKYVKYDQEKLAAVDVVNSQPLLALIVLDFDMFMKNEVFKIIAHYNENHKQLVDMDKLSIFNNPTSTMLVNLIRSAHTKTDVLIFKEAVIEGNFYELFGELLLKNNLLPIDIRDSREEVRKFAKTAVFTAFFSRIRDARWNAHIKAFRKCFPTVFRIFNVIKHGKDHHETLACLLQRFESDLVLHNACVEINGRYPNIPLFTIHDSIVTTESNVLAVEGIFLKHLKLKLGVMPRTKIEYWS